VPHHGSNTSSPNELIQNLQPKVAIISAGKNNIYGHPHDEVIKRYIENNVSIYRTDQSGLIRVYIDKKGFQVDAFLKEEQNVCYLIKTYYSQISLLIIYSIVIYISIKYYIKANEELKRFELERVY